MLHSGLYEQVINNQLDNELLGIPEARQCTAPIDKAEASKVASLQHHPTVKLLGKSPKRQKRFLPISTRWDWKRIRVILFTPSLMRKSRPWMAAGFVFASWMTLKSMA